ncbi:MAG TPA: HK97 gp10 family phage protein [Oscillospiraceae bacterium]|nr:HK97 gp10 family phage protein [Oscillospiraceae bacterium]
MGRITIKMPTEFMDQLAKAAEKTDAAIPKALEAGGKVVFETMKANLRSAIGRDTKYPSRSTGKLLAALGVSPVKLNDEGNFDVKVGFSEDREVSNAKLANILEYGKHGQPPKPILKPTRKSSRKPCIEAMQAALKEELGLK